jgi:hypothetical protein
MSKTTKANGQGQCALQTFSEFRNSCLQGFNHELVSEAFLEGGLLIDPSPIWNNYLLVWEVSATEECGNCEAIASFETEKEGQSFIDGLLLLAATKKGGESL